MTRLQSILLPCFLAATIASADENITAVMSATFKIVNKDSSATCFVVAAPRQSDSGPRELILLTAAHVFEKMAGDECRIVLREKRADGTFQRDEVILKIRSEEKPLWVRHADVDVGAIRFNLPSDQTVPALKWDQLAGESKLKAGGLRLADEVWVVGYPAQLESNSAGFPVLRMGTVASFPLMPITDYKTFLVAANTFGGDSGGPVSVAHSRRSDTHSQRPMVVGLVLGLQRETTKSVTSVEERTFHRPLGLAIVVHAEYIRQTVELLLKSQ